MATDANNLHSDDRVAHAIDQVLEAERAAQAAIAGCENETAESLERARQWRRACLERAQARIAALHAQVAQSLELRTAQLAEQRRQSAAAIVVELSDAFRHAATLERVAALLTGGDERHDA